MVRDRRAPEEVPAVAIAPGERPPAGAAGGPPRGFASRSEARRLIAGGGVSLDGEPVTELDLPAERLDGRVIRAGKRRFARLRVRAEPLTGPGGPAGALTCGDPAVYSLDLPGGVRLPVGQEPD